MAVKMSITVRMFPMILLQSIYLTSQRQFNHLFYALERRISAFGTYLPNGK